MVCKIIYLDQNVWIYLAQVYYGKNKNPDMIITCNKILEASESNNAIFPLSVVHILETIKHLNKEQCEKLIDFMMKVSKGYTILPYPFIMELEVEQAMLKRLNLPYISLKNLVTSKGISYMIGAKPSIIGDMLNLDEKQLKKINVPEDLKDQLLQSLDKSENQKEVILRWLNSPNALMWILKNSIMNIDIKQITQDCQLIKELEEIRSDDNEIKDKSMRYKLTLAKNVILTLAPKMEKINKKYGLAIDAVIKKDWKEEDFLSFIEDIPTFYVSFNLTNRRDRNFNRTIKENDLYDISALSAAIPYCDIIVTEKMFASIAKQTKIDQKYNTIIITASSLKEIQKYI